MIFGCDQLTNRDPKGRPTFSTSTIGSGCWWFRAQPVAACRSTPGWRILALMGTKSRESIYGSSVRHSAERAAEARKETDRLACVAWNQRMLGFQRTGLASPSLGDALNAGFLYLEVRCLGCDTHQTVALNVVRRPKPTPIRREAKAIAISQAFYAKRRIAPPRLQEARW